MAQSGSRNEKIMAVFRCICGGYIPNWDFSACRYVSMALPVERLSLIPRKPAIWIGAFKGTPLMVKGNTSVA